VIALLTYMGGHWPLVIAAVLAVGGLGAAAFFLRSPKMALAAVVLAVAGFLYQGAVTDGIKLQMAKDYKMHIELLEDHIKTMEAANEADVKRALEDQKTIDQLQEQVNATPRNDASCLDDAAAGRLSHIR
jgi:capsular polysaccharide biosynthesis protein